VSFPSVRISEHPKLISSSVEVTPLLNLEKCSKTCVISDICSPRAAYNISEVCDSFSQFKENDVETNIFKPAILQV
jgi:hypothetical protein